ncbi:MAG TPA: helix-hairpin-helix domain-containing protein [Casimicrobiaceae bacterium]|jgi:competence protein ComEA|nr:helix-hairpin-helix domain-containing protein [Casimicrobiaceae bacterium]
MLKLLPALALALFMQPALAALDLNTATKDELVALPGIGPAKAQAILDYRTQHNGFQRVEELKDVKGIGAKRYEKLKAEFSVAPPRATAAPKPSRAESKPPRVASGEVKPGK